MLSDSSPSWSPYRGETYLDYPQLLAWCEQVVAAHPGWLSLEQYGRSRLGRPLILLTLHLGSSPPRDCSAFWLDGGTHASEWAGVMATLFTLSRWLERLRAGELELTAFCQHHTIYIAPCLSPDGFQLMREGGSYVRSTLRPPREGTLRLGLDARDLDGDGEVLWMRWRHPAGPWVEDERLPCLMRPRRLDDDPAQAYFVCSEGTLLEHSGEGWVAAPARHGVDLNRNFPVHWAPFSQFGIEGGEFALSEPESRAVVDALHARPNVCAALTNHTYTGCILVSPYRPETSVPGWDLETLSRLATDAVRDTGYKVLKVYPEFQYEPGKPIPGVWADYLVSVQGIVGYTLELWDPYGFAGIDLKDPARAFFRADLDAIRTLVEKFLTLPGTWKPWTPFAHPQLGPVEIGGLREQWTVRNPPLPLLPGELERAFTVADRLRRALPEPTLELHARVLAGGAEGGPRVLEATVRNLGYLGTWALTHAEKAQLTPLPVVQLELGEGLWLEQGPVAQTVPHLSGWGDAPMGFRLQPLHPALPDQPCLQRIAWTIGGAGVATVRWEHPRGGRLTATQRLG